MPSSCNSPKPVNDDLFVYDAPGGEFCDIKQALERRCVSDNGVDPWFKVVHPSHFKLNDNSRKRRLTVGPTTQASKARKAAIAGRKMSTGGVRRVVKGEEEEEVRGEGS